MMNTNNDRNQTEKLTAARIRLALALIVKNVLLLPVRIVMFVVNAIGDLFKFSLTYRIGLIYTLLTMVALIAFNYGLNNSISFLWQKNQIGQLNALKEVYVAVLQDAQSIDLSPLARHVEAQSITLNVYDEAQRIIKTTNVQSPELAFNIEGEKAVAVKSGNNSYLLSGHSLKIAKRSYYLQLVKDISGERALLDKVAYVGFLIALVILALVMYLGSKVSVQLLNPIREMTDRIRQITVKRLDMRLDESVAQNELKDLTVQFNALLDKIEDAYGKQNQFVSDASHELRTPISVINGYAEMLDRWGKRDKEILDESIQAIKAETQQMKALIEKLLFLARSDRGKIEMEVGRLELSPLVAELCRETEMIDQKHKIECQIDQPLAIYGNEKMLKQMMRIFIENAINYTDDGGTISIGVQTSGDDAVLFVEDNGVGIAQEDLPKIFDRFYKADKSRTKNGSGSGLGLSIAKWIIDQHGAVVRVYSKTQVGTKIEVLFKENESLVS